MSFGYASRRLRLNSDLIDRASSVKNLSQVSLVSETWVMNDKPNFTLHFNDGMILVRQLPREHFGESCIKEHEQYDTGRIMTRTTKR